MKILNKLALIAAVLTTAATAQAEWVSGHFRSNGAYVAPYYRSGSGLLGSSGSGASSSYVYRNPFAASPSVRVDGYTRDNGIYVAPHVRTAPNRTLTDNLNYRGYGTVRTPRSLYGW